MREGEWRKLSRPKRKILDRLLEVEFPGRDELRQQLARARVRTLDEEGSSSFPVRAGAPAAVKDRVPINARFHDNDGVPVDILLHVVDGVLQELEIYKLDGSRIKHQPEASELVIYS